MSYNDQTTVQDEDALRIGSVKWEVGASVGTLVDVGALRGAAFKEGFTPEEIESDNAGIISKGVTDHMVLVSAELMELDLATFANIYAGIGTLTTVAAAPVSITDEAVEVNDYDLVAFENRNGDRSEVSSIVVADAATPTITYIRDCDYVVVTKPNGFTAIARAFATVIEADSIKIAVESTSEYVLSAGAYDVLPAIGDHITVTGFTTAANNGVKTVLLTEATKITVSDTLSNEAEGDTINITKGAIADGATVYADYDYTPLASQSYTTGGKNTLTDRVMRFTNEDVDGKVFRLTVYKAVIQDGLDLTFPMDKSLEPIRLPISIKGTLDTSRTSGDQLFGIYDEQNAT